MGVVIALLALFGCTAAPVVYTPTAPTQASFADLLFEEGRYEEAGGAYADEALRDARNANEWRLRAAQSYLRAELPGLAERQLAGIQRVRGPMMDVRALLNAAVAIARNEEPLPFDTLLAMDVNALPETYRPDYGWWRSRAESAGQDHEAAARSLVARTETLTLEADLRNNERAILKTVLRLPAAEARELAARLEPGDPLGPWLELSADVKESLLSGASPDAAIDQWRQRYPDHPGGTMIALELGIGPTDPNAPPGIVAVLVPTTGPLAFAGKAIRDGVLAAWLETPMPRPELMWFDTGSDAGRAIDSFNIAVERGATFVLGPLDRGALRAVAREAQDYNVPVIGLNTLEMEEGQPLPDAPVFQFGLNPEDEARAIAELMLSHGHQRALTLVPQDGWGERLALAFTRAFESGGGLVVAAAAYDGGGSDHGGVLRQALGLEASAARHRKLSRQLGVNLGFEPRRRGDVEALFLGARVTQARLIKPQLRFHHAVDLPVYATSHIFNGTVDASIDTDLEGVYFTDSPWLLSARGYQPTYDEAAQAQLQSSGGAARLFALGMDAWRILPYLPWLAYSAESYPGATGDLSIQAAGEITRRPAFAQFRRGTPRVVELVEEAGP